MGERFATPSESSTTYTFIFTLDSEADTHIHTNTVILTADVLIGILENSDLVQRFPVQECIDLNRWLSETERNCCPEVTSYQLDKAFAWTITSGVFLRMVSEENHGTVTEDRAASFFETAVHFEEADDVAMSFSTSII